MLFSNKKKKKSNLHFLKRQGRLDSEARKRKCFLSMTIGYIPSLIQQYERYRGPSLSVWKDSERVQVQGEESIQGRYHVPVLHMHVPRS